MCILYSMGFIYILTSPSGKSYIGQTNRPIEERFKEHQKSNSNCVAIYNAIQYHGWEKFEKDWYECPDKDLNFDEELLIEKMRTLAPNGYNLREGGGNNGKMSDESKQKMSKARLGHIVTEETKQKISKALIGEKNQMYGKTHTNESKKKMSKALSGENNYKSRRVYQYTIDDTYINSFASGGEAAQAFGKTDGSSISRCARGEQNTAYGFKWSYAPPLPHLFSA
ncbi:GIY-YIG catalytic domain-containing endonuclease [Paramecium bursaria Chlorella virus CVG-1]|nr:GIY-YIG catalytic domain-containing endonuclease [Paramecium bursaria Chlorella virus CVG-1]